jgi:hypothetical protein
MACCEDKNCCTCVDSADCDRGISLILDGLARSEKDFESEKCKIENNITALKSYIDSMDCAISKAMNGSTCETGYFLEKLERMCNRLNYNLVKRG